jgi:hypothetical protein
MNSFVNEYYRRPEQIDGVEDPFYEVMLIDDTSEMSWEKIKEIAPQFPKGWFELCHLPVKDRIEFVYEFWLSRLPFVPHINGFLSSFFANIDDIAVYITRDFKNQPFNIEMVYSLRSNTNFFRGRPFISKDEVTNINQQFSSVLPSDFLAFLEIHNGFAKHADTGIITAEAMPLVATQVSKGIMNEGKSILCGASAIDPRALIPFYQCFGRNFFQCFYADWYPGVEMGNVYYSGVDNTISNYHNVANLSEQLAFPSFLEWLIFYLEEVEL